ncbi:5'-3' exoribonuclease [Bienertia sinuspersici]
MMGDGNKNKRKKKKRGGAKRRMTAEQTSALKSVNEWVFMAEQSINNEGDELKEKYDDFLPESMYRARVSEKVVFELHTHSICSDGFLTPSALVEKAHQNGVKVLALTDHDTMSGIPEALEAAYRFGIKIIPGVEISSVFSTRQVVQNDLESEEPVHILAYYSSCGPARFEEFDQFLTSIRDGRFLRAKTMLSKLNNLKKPVKWENLMKIAGNGVAPGRLHVARALLEAGHVEDLKQAFDRYLYDGGPAYSKGSEPPAEEAVEMVCKTGGIAVLAHPWALKNPLPVVKRLKEAGLHGIEVYRSDGKLAVYSDYADAYGLIKLGGSDYHGRGGRAESPLGSVNLPVLSAYDFLKIARPIWCNAIRETLEQYIKDPSELNLKHITRFGIKRVTANTCEKNIINICLRLWLTSEEMQHSDFRDTMLKLTEILLH